MLTFNYWATAPLGAATVLVRLHDFETWSLGLVVWLVSVLLHSCGALVFDASRSLIAN